MATNPNYESWGRSKRFSYIKNLVDKQMQDIYSSPSVSVEPSTKKKKKTNAVDDTLEIGNLLNAMNDEEIDYRSGARDPPTICPSEDNDDDHFSDVDSIVDSHVLSTDDESNGHDSCNDDILNESVVNLTEDTSPLGLREHLKLFSLECNIAHTSLRRLLYHLKPFHPDLPIDPRTIMKGPTKVAIETMGAGLYYHFGVANQLSNSLRNVSEMPKTITLDFNVDGLQIFKSTNVDFWPILCRPREIRYIPPFACTVYGGTGKANLDDYLKDFVPELQQLKESGLRVGSKMIRIEIGNFICDRPARAYVKAIKGHSGYDGCDKCVTHGVHIGRVVFPETCAELRTDENFHSDRLRDHRIGNTNLSLLDIGMITQFPNDVMHLVYLGVTRKLLRTWTMGELRFRISPVARRLISDDLIAMGKIWPDDFSRKPRSLSELDRWKATELRQFLLYVGPVTLSKKLPKRDYKLFLLLHTASIILCRKDLYMKFNSKAHELLMEFVENCIHILGEKFLSYNVHSLIHLAKDAADHGPVDSFSAFPFENFLGPVKKLIRGKNKPVQQFVYRTLEKNGMARNEIQKPTAVIEPFETSRHYSGPTGGKTGKQYSKINWNGTILSSKAGNNVVILANGKIVVIVNFVLSDEQLFFAARKYTSYSDFYTVPLESSKLGIYRVAKLSNRVKIYPISKIAMKGLMLPNGSSNVVYPLQTECS